MLRNNVLALTVGGGVLLSLMTCEGQPYEQWPMGGRDGVHSGYFEYKTPVEFTPTAGTLKWSFTPPSGVHVNTGVALADTETGNDYQYKFYFGADDHKLYCRRVLYDSGNHTFSVSTTVTDKWEYTIDDWASRDGSLLSDATGMPVFWHIANNDLIFITTTHGRVHCVAADGACVALSRPPDELDGHSNPTADDPDC